MQSERRFAPAGLDRQLNRNKRDKINYGSICCSSSSTECPSGLVYGDMNACQIQDRRFHPEATGAGGQVTQNMVALGRGATCKFEEHRRRRLLADPAVGQQCDHVCCKRRPGRKALGGADRAAFTERQFRSREEFRAPPGVRKSSKNEPGGRRRWSMGISVFGSAWRSHDRQWETRAVMRSV